MKFIAQVLVYNEADCLERAVTPWLGACEQISVFEGAFQTLRNLGYSARSTDGTVEVAQKLAKDNSNVRLTNTEVFNEPILRNNHLFETARDFGRDDTVLFILDGDEIYSPEEVKLCIAQVEAEIESTNTWWVNFRNYVNDEKHYYDGFHVPRFFRMKTALGFSGYNNVAFEEGVKETDVRHVLPKHYSWLPIAKSRQKLRWQSESLGWVPSWVEKDGQLILNDTYYQQTGKQKPVIHAYE